MTVEEPMANLTEEREETTPVDSVETLLERTLSSEELADQTEAQDEPIEVTFATQDYPVDGLVSRLNKNTMIIPQFGVSSDKVKSAKFQRGFVWTKKQMDKFIESLLLGYPIPGIFLVKQPGDNRLLVLDGQQRLETLRRFYSGTTGDRVFSLQNVSPRFEGLTYEKLGEEQQIALDNSFMQATIVTADGSDEVYEAIYQIFERLNSGGTQLTPHEIRIALYPGELMEGIAQLNLDPNWRALYGTSEPSSRLRDHELILRTFALFDDAQNYRRPQKTFLNSYASKHQHVNFSTDDRGKLFLSTVETLRSRVGIGALRREDSLQINAAMAEAILMTVMDGIRGDVINRIQDLESRIRNLKEDEDFLNATSRATADKEAVKLRLKRARYHILDRVR